MLKNTEATAPTIEITSQMIETAARILATSEEANPAKWSNYADVTKAMLNAALNDQS